MTTRKVKPREKQKANGKGKAGAEHHAFEALLDYLHPMTSCARSTSSSSAAPVVEVDAVNRRGVAIRCVVTCTPLHQDGEITGAIVLIQRSESAAEPAAVERGGR